VVLAGEHERVQQARLVDRRGGLVGVLGDDREQVGQQLALERRQVGGRLRRRGRVRARAADRAALDELRQRSVIRLGYAAAWMLFVRNRLPSSRRRP
jgi:hypothetical protein